MKASFAVSSFFFIMFGYYSYAFYTGSWLVQDEVNNTNYAGHHPYDTGALMTCFFGIVFGVFSLGMATPNIKAVTEGRVAGKMAFDIIEREPRIPLDDEYARDLNQIEGTIEFKDVTFRYPTR